MKRLILIIAYAVLIIPLFTQELAHETLVVNIEVQVRVYKGSEFINDLTKDDFEVYEDGKLQKIEAVYLIKKTKIEKKEVEKEKKFSPRVSRHFVLLFQIYDYLPKIEEAIDYFFKNVILPGDTLTIMTSTKTYNLKSDALEKLSKEKIVSQLKGKIRKDTLIGNTEYRNAIKDLEEILSGGFPSGGLEIYRAIRERLENFRYIDEKKLLKFADYLKENEGQKYVFLFYQKEVLPELDTKTKLRIISLSQDRPNEIAMIYDLFEFFHRDITFDVNRIKQAFADSLISIHFLFITKTHMRRLPITSMRPSEELRYVERSEDIFSAFREMANATGGLTDSSANAASAFQRAVDASENYYLLYYSPLNYVRDGKFRSIKVKVKDKSYRITHRAGYFAN